MADGAGHLPGCDTFEWDEHDPQVFGACSQNGARLVPDLRTAKAVEAVVAQIRIVAAPPGRPYGGDDPRAHVMEDLLHETVLREIAEGNAEDPAGMAAAALQTGEIEFSRWYE